MAQRQSTLEDVVIDPQFWRGKSVFLTGHTGFKGSWAANWLTSVGARVHGYALAPPTTPAMFVETGLADRLASHVIGDVRDGDALHRAMAAAAPDIVLHMAAQPLVRASYDRPAETYDVNVMGTVNLLEAVRRVGSVAALVNVTTDKCYENREWHWGYREGESLGGHDPYSSSKACAELVTAAYRSSFCGAGSPWIATARAGNVIGGGDWALDRLVPDVLRAVDARAPLSIRSPGATRPWQHVLEPVAGYLKLAEALVLQGEPFARAWNFGPADDDAQPVSWILRELQALLPDLEWSVPPGSHPHEAGFLKLDSSAAKALLHWRPRWALATALAKTVEWHDAWKNGQDMGAVTLAQIADYTAASGAGAAANGR